MKPERENNFESAINAGLAELSGHDSVFPVSHVITHKHNFKFFENLESAKTFIRQVFIRTDASITESNFVWYDCYDKIANYLIGNNSKGLVMLGTMGTGKTRILNSVIPVAFAMLKPQPRIFQPVNSYDLNNTNYRRLMEKHYIGIDELGCEPLGNDYGSKFEMTEIIVDHCEKNGKLFFATTNLPYKQLVLRYGQPCIDRMTKICYFVEFQEKSLR